MPRDFERWLKQPPRNLAFTEYMRLNDEDRRLLLEAYEKHTKRVAEKVGREEHRRKESLNRYLEKLRRKKHGKADQQQ